MKEGKSDTEICIETNQDGNENDISKMVPIPSPSPGPGTRGLVPSDTQLSYMMTPRNTMSITHTKGLLNMPGQNNCFLNSAVQVLWHLDIFRRSFRQLSGHTCMAESCIFCALKELFTQFQYSQESALPPDALRRALAETFCDQRRFQLGFMDDAAECFENILQRIHFHIASQQSEDMCSVAHCISHQKFAMVLIEQTCCHACGATSEPLPFTQMVHYVSASALCSQSSATKQEYSKQSFGELLKRAGGMGDIRACPSSCGAKIQIRRVLINQPEIVSIGLVWDSERPTLEHIMEVFQTIGTVIHLTDIFHSVVDSKWAKTAMHQLVGVVTYYGKHYSTFFFHTKLRIWIYFDDATVREIGPSWDQVVEKCRRGHFQPLLLLYANPNGTPVSTSTAPRTVTLATNHKKKIAKMVEATPAVHMPEHNAQTKKLAQLSNIPLRTIPSDILMKEEYQNTKYSSFSGYHHHMNNHNCQKHNVYGYSSSLPSTSCMKGCQCHHFHPSDHSVHTAHCHFVDCENYQSTSQENILDISNDQETYISRKAVESVLNFQKLQRQKSLSTIENRNSISSLDSFENQTQKTQLKLDIPDAENLSRRRDSGNWSGDRNSASSSSSTSIDNPYLFAIGNKWLHPPGFRHGIAGKSNHDYINVFSDQGYDSFSLSSTDSYPSVGTASMKLDPRLCQIPESLILVDNKTVCKQQPVSTVDCDKLCTEADLFLNKSHEKEQEGDLVMAALLSDLAASRARAAMDAPYSNSRSLVSAKMKHSTCVMRSSCLHRRLNEIETTEKRKQKEAEISHSRQSSRDSSHGRHSRQGSKSSKKSVSDGLDKSKKTIELYGTLPKKGSSKKDHQTEKSKDEQIYKDFLEKQRQSSKSEQQKQTTEKRKQFRTDGIASNKTKSDIDTVDKTFSKIGIFEKSPSFRMNRQKKSPPQQKVERKDSGFNECPNDWEQTKRPSLFRTYSGPAAVKDMVCEGTCQTNKKQHKIKQKLMGGFMRRKNRSLPDLREGQEMSDHEARSYDDFSINIDNQTRKNDVETPLPHISRVSHQPLRAYINKNVNQRPLLIRVSPPQVRAKAAKPLLAPFTSTSKVEAREVTAKPEISEDELPPPTNSFLAELQAKRKQIMKPKNEQETDTNQNGNCKTNSLLQELQNKHHQMMEKRTQPLQMECPTENYQLKEIKKFDRTAPLTDNLQMTQKQETTFKNTEGNVLSYSTETFVTNNTRQSDPILQKEKEIDSEEIEQKSCSVKDLASKFENIFCAKLQPQNSIRTSSLRIINSEKIIEDDKNNQQKQNSELKLFNANGNHINEQSVCDIPVHEELTKIETIESNNQKLPIEPRRPIRPPDYETAVQRLCLLRDMALSEAEMKMAIVSDSKKKSGTKKTVTFSDKVVLVACADDDVNDYLPNPVFERVYRQHMQNFSANEDKPDLADSGNQQTVLPCQQSQQTPISCQQSQQAGILCQLCRKKFINMPTVYCSDCAFYMARFQPRQ